jgi:hypothetical protein
MNYELKITVVAKKVRILVVNESMNTQNTILLTVAMIQTPDFSCSVTRRRTPLINFRPWSSL